MANFNVNSYRTGAGNLRQVGADNLTHAGACKFETGNLR